MGAFFKRSDEDVNRVFPGGHASWKNLEKEPAIRYTQDSTIYLQHARKYQL